MRTRLTILALLIVAGVASACSSIPTEADHSRDLPRDAVRDSTSGNNPGTLEKGGYWTGTGH